MSAEVLTTSEAAARRGESDRLVRLCTQPISISLFDNLDEAQSELLCLSHFRRQPTQQLGRLLLLIRQLTRLEQQPRGLAR
jgi:hypothetical protein